MPAELNTCCIHVNCISVSHTVCLRCQTGLYEGGALRARLSVIWSWRVWLSKCEACLPSGLPLGFGGDGLKTGHHTVPTKKFITDDFQGNGQGKRHAWVMLLVIAGVSAVC